MIKCLKYWIPFLVLMCACSVKEEADSPVSGSVELRGIKTQIAGSPLTRAAVLEDYVGRSEFKGGDQVVFTEIRRTLSPIASFTYPGDGNYAGIVFNAGAEGGWIRDDSDGGPERVYWTDAINAHTFVAYGIPQTASYDWHPYHFTEESVAKTYYVGSLGNPLTDGEIDFNLSSEQQTAIENEDLLIAYDADMKAETGGSVAFVRFYHALSSVRVVVNISGFSSSSSAADNRTVVSNMRLLHQPTMYLWEQSSACAQPFRGPAEYAPLEQAIVDAAWGGAGPAYNQRKNIRLWIPNPSGSGINQGKTYTFYGITIPQPQSYISTLDGDNVGYKKTELSFDVTYPDPLLPSNNVTRTYTASLDNVYFEAGYNTTINISLNHRYEQMTVGAEYENWQFVSTPDVSHLFKNSTLLHDVDYRNVTLVGDEMATVDDATWLYEDAEHVIRDIYGHDGSSPENAYQISTAYQLLSFALEVKAAATDENGKKMGGGRDFSGKYIRLDADLTLQPSSDTEDESLLSWVGIGDATHPFNGSFIGGERFLYNLSGNPMFMNLGSDASVVKLQVSAHKMTDGSAAVSGTGLFADINSGLLSACQVMGDVVLNGSTAGAFVGTNNGMLYACYHIGATKSTGVSASVGGLVGSNASTGTIRNCFQAGNVVGTVKGGVVAVNEGTLNNNYYNRTLATPTVSFDGVNGKTTLEMTLPSFVTAINDNIGNFGEGPAPADLWSYVLRPADYPKIGEYLPLNGWLQTDLDRLAPGDVFVIVGNNGNTFAMANDAANASARISAVPVTVVDGEVTSTVPANLRWNLSSQTVEDVDQYTFYPNGSTAKWLYCVNDNYLHLGTGENKAFILDLESIYLKNAGTGRYVGIYNSQDWRAYASITNNIKNQSFTFYKYYDDGKNATVSLTYDGGAVTTGSQPIVLTLTKPAGLHVTVTSTDTSVATVSGTITDESTGGEITVTIVGAGSSHIRASWDESASYHAGHYDYELTVSEPDNSVTYSMTLDSSNNGNNQVHLTAVESFAFDGTDDETDNPVTWTPAVTWQNAGAAAWQNSLDSFKIGTGSKPIASFSITTAGFAGKTIKSVSVTCCYTSYTGASNKPTLTITAGNTAMLAASAMTKTTLTQMETTVNDVTLGTTENQNLVIRIDSSVAAGISISAVTIVYEE